MAWSAISVSRDEWCGHGQWMKLEKADEDCLEEARQLKDKASRLSLFLFSSSSSSSLFLWQEKNRVGSFCQRILRNLVSRFKVVGTSKYQAFQCAKVGPSMAIDKIYVGVGVQLKITIRLWKSCRGLDFSGWIVKMLRQPFQHRLFKGAMSIDHQLAIIKVLSII